MYLLSEIHSEKNPTSMESSLASYVADIKIFLGPGDFVSQAYYINHIGRELNTQMIRFGLEKYFAKNGGHNGITLDNPGGGGYRPSSVNHVKT